ncbi:MAG TPA: 3-hydroxyacyl-CoA dehydrogenase NAD-binding domain-containing protein, partial [Solirubrobacterales bacterium]|nr:3-hydroxyacyl-CoA dehydrogenase NAD-binding domain-containing protein [Solirubrobacterales bacterium]
MTVSRVGVVGAGTMGGGIAQVAALGGFETVLYDEFPEVAEARAANIGEDLAKGAARRRWSDEEAEVASERVHPAEDFAELAGCDLVIEAAPEKLELKRDLFTRLAELLGPEAVLASNTSSLCVS